MKRIVLDTETTGIGEGHRIIEIGAMELVHRSLIGGAQYHQYIQPERVVDPQAFRVHGISNDFLSDQPVFKDIAADFLAFIQGAELIIHNAPFDLGFINMEFARLSGYPKVETICTVTDTLVLARKKHPGRRNSLDALCKRYAIDNTGRTLHGALKDTALLAQVYLKMTEAQLALNLDQTGSDAISTRAASANKIDVNQLPLIEANSDELAAHQAFLKKIQPQDSDS